MSDEEDYYEDEWEVIHDDGFGAQADDLAEHSLPSPPYLDYDSDGMDNLNDSDQEMEGAILEYLDFYYDDDPSLMNPRNSIDQSPASVSTRKRKGEELARVKKKRKTDIADEAAQDFIQNSSITGRGIIWRVENGTGPPIYQPGEGEKVALLKDWRQLSTAPTNGDEEPTSNLQTVVKGRDKKQENALKSAEPVQAPGLGKPTKAPQLAKGPKLRIRAASRPSPLSHSVSSDDLPTATSKSPQNSSSAALPVEQDIPPGSVVPPPTSRKRKLQDTHENDRVDSKRKVVSGKEKEQGNVATTRQTRSRKAAGT